MKIRSIFYHLKQGFKNIYRNRLFSLASIATITACVFLFGVFYSIMMNFEYMVKKAENEVCRSEERRVGKECRSRCSPYH